MRADYETKAARKLKVGAVKVNDTWDAGQVNTESCVLCQGLEVRPRVTFGGGHHCRQLLVCQVVVILAPARRAKDTRAHDNATYRRQIKPCELSHGIITPKPCRTEDCAGWRGGPGRLAEEYRDA